MLDQTTRTRLADSYLAHLVIALEAGDQGAPFRTFLDNWYAYTVATGHLTAGGRPIWFNNPCARRHQSALSSMHFISAGAAAILDSSRSDPNGYQARRADDDRSVRLMVDHAIPLRVLQRTMFDDAALRSVDALRGYLQTHYRLGVITDDENARLNSNRLVSAMPPDWDGKDPFARYCAAHIVSSCRDF